MTFGQSTISVKLPLNANSADEENATGGARSLLEPIEYGSGKELEEDCGGVQGRRTTSSRAQTEIPMLATSISWDEVVVVYDDRWTVES